MTTLKVSIWVEEDSCYVCWAEYLIRYNVQQGQLHHFVCFFLPTRRTNWRFFSSHWFWKNFQLIDTWRWRKATERLVLQAENLVYIQAKTSHTKIQICRFLLYWYPDYHWLSPVTLAWRFHVTTFHETALNVKDNFIPYCQINIFFQGQQIYFILHQ